MSNFNIRSVATINAAIDAINKNAEDTGVEVNAAELHVLTLEAKAAGAIAKFERASYEFEAQARVAAVNVGDVITIVHGRAATKRIESGNVLSIEVEKTGPQFTVLTGSGKDSAVRTVGADAVLLDAEQVALVQAEIDEAVEAKRLADEAKAAGSEA